MGVGRIKKQVTSIMHNRNVMDNSYRTKRVESKSCSAYSCESLYWFQYDFFSKKDVCTLNLSPCSSGSLEKCL